MANNTPLTADANLTPESSSSSSATTGAAGQRRNYDGSGKLDVAAEATEKNHSPVEHAITKLGRRVDGRPAEEDGFGLQEVTAT